MNKHSIPDRRLNLSFEETAPSSIQKDIVEYNRRLTPSSTRIISTESEREFKNKSDDLFFDLVNFGDNPERNVSSTLRNNWHMKAIATVFSFWEDKLPQIIHLYDASELSYLYRLFNATCTFPSDESLELIENRIAETIDDFTYQNISQLGFNIASTGRNIDNNFLKTILARINECKEEMQEHELANSLFFMTIMSLLKNVKNPSPLMYEIRGRLEGIPNLGISGKKRIMQFSICFDQAHIYKFPRESDDGSNIEKKVVAIFNQAGYLLAAQPDELKNEGNHVDIPLKHGKFRFLAEVDGPTHFMHQLKHGVLIPTFYDGQTFIKTVVHSKLCMNDRILRLPLITCNYLLSKEGRDAAPEILQELFDGLVRADPGAYIIDIDYPADKDSEHGLLAIDFMDFVRINNVSAPRPK